MEIQFINVDFKLNGYLLKSYDIISIKSINVSFEYDYSAGGYFIISSCNFPEAPVIGELIFKNNTIFMKNELMNDLMPAGYLSYSGPFNLTLEEI